MEAKQVWRAALGGLQVSLSPANFETWLRDTMLVDVDDNRFRIAVPNGFAKDWLESRYRSLISQTLARIVGYSVQVEFVVGTPPDASLETSSGAATHAPPTPPPQVRVEPTPRGGAAGRRHGRLKTRHALTPPKPNEFDSISSGAPSRPPSVR